MKKKTKNYKAQNSRFILIVIFILLIVNKLAAQCTDNWIVTATCTSTIHEESQIDFSHESCYETTPPTVTDLALTNADKTTPSITIGYNTSSLDPVTMSVDNVTLYNSDVVPCALIDGPFPDPPLTLLDFATKYGITFTNDADGNIVITKTRIVTSATFFGITKSVIGWPVYFTITATQGASSVQRNYFFKLSGSPKLLGDPHITTVNGVNYDFQAVGEFVTLRDDHGDNFEIQTRQTAITTAPPANDSYSGLKLCVSVITAVAARVGTHRVTYEPDSGVMQLRVDGKLTELGENGLDLGSGGRIVKPLPGAGAIEIDFPNGASLVVTFTCCYYNQWHLGLSIYNTFATKGIAGVIHPESWLPELPDGKSLGPMPNDPHERYVQLYEKFADSWRVTDKTSLFDYPSGKSTAFFTDKAWPKWREENDQSSCSLPGQTPPKPIKLEEAQKLCRDIADPNMRANAIFDVMVTGDTGFVKSYLLTQQVKTGTTAIIVNDSKDTTKHKDPVTFTAIVSRKFSLEKDIPRGSVEFTIDGKKSEQVKLEANGLAMLTTASLEVGRHQIIATFIPDAGSTAFSSSSLEVKHTVIGKGGTSIFHQWWFWLILVIIFLLVIWLIRKKK